MSPSLGMVKEDLREVVEGVASQTSRVQSPFDHGCEVRSCLANAKTKRSMTSTSSPRHRYAATEVQVLR